LVVLFYILFSFFWIFPYISSTLYGIGPKVRFVLTEEGIIGLSRYASILNTFRLHNYFEPLALFDNPPFSTEFYIIISILTPLLAFSSLLFKNGVDKGRKLILVTSCFALIYIFLSKGVNPPFAEFYSWIIFKAPYIKSFFWLYRAPFKWTFLLSFTYSLLIGLTISQILRKTPVMLTNTARTLGVLIIIAIPLINGYPLLTGNLNGYMQPVEIPSDYLELHNWMWRQDGEFKIVVLPIPPDFGTPKPTIVYGPTVHFTTMFNNYFGGIKVNEIGYVKRLLHENRTKNLGTLLSFLNVKYIVVAENGYYTEPGLQDIYLKLESKKVIDILHNQKDLSFIRNFGTYYVFENKKYIQNIHIPTHIILISGGLEKISQLLLTNNINSINASIIFLDISLDQSIDSSFITGTNIIVTYYKNYSLYIPFIKEKLVMSPFYDTIHEAPSKFWSRAAPYDPPHGRWHYHVIGRDIENWDFDYGYGLVFTWAKDTKLAIPFKLEKSDNYKLFIRYFKNQKGGEIKVYLDGRPIEIKTKDQLNKFVWKDLDTYYLEKGEYEIVLENVEGFNAVNLFVLTPEKDYYKAKEEVEKLLQNKTVIYLLEAESDLYRSNARVIKNINFNSGEALASGSGKTWQDIEIIKNGTYKLALKGIGSFEISIGNKIFNLTSHSLNFTYSPMFYLERGTYKLEIKPLSDNAMLDVLWLYSTETNQTIDQLFSIKENPAKVISYEKINPTLWKVKVNATKPFMLSFAEAYDPLWEARVYKDGRKVETVKSIPLYSVINGFWINETGNLEITIRYKPQDWFEIGLMISATTFIGCVGYLFYDWRKERGDEWTLRVENSVRRVMGRK
jgi:hypothetical protein